MGSAMCHRRFISVEQELSTRVVPNRDSDGLFFLSCYKRSKVGKTRRDAIIRRVNMPRNNQIP